MSQTLLLPAGVILIALVASLFLRGHDRKDEPVATTPPA